MKNQRSLLLVRLRNCQTPSNNRHVRKMMRMTPDEFKVQLAREYLEVEKEVKRLDIKLY